MEVELKLDYFLNSRLKAIKKQMGHAVAETDAEEEALKAQYIY